MGTNISAILVVASAILSGPTTALAMSNPDSAVANSAEVGVFEDPCERVAAMPPEVATYFGALAKARVEKTSPPIPTAEQILSYRNWQARVLQQDFSQHCKYAAANSALTPATRDRVVYFGDSITEFWGAYDPAFFQEDIINRGISGQTTAQMIGRFRADVIELKPAVVHIVAGTNDVAGNTGPTSMNRIVGNIASMVELAKLHGIKVVLGSELPCAKYASQPAVQPVAVLAELNRRLRDLAQRENIIFIDYFTPMADAESGFDKRFSDDGLHPNAAGYAVMAPLAKAGVVEALASR